MQSLLHDITDWGSSLNKQVSGGILYFHQHTIPWVHYGGKSGQNTQGQILEAGTEAESMEEHGLLACSSWLVQPTFLQHQDHHPAQGGTILSRLSPLVAIINQENAPQACLWYFLNWVSSSHVWWDAHLYAVNMSYYHWFIKNLIWPIARQNIARREIQREIEREKGQSLGGASSYQRSKMWGIKPQASW